MFEKSCESISLAADDYGQHKWMWPDYGNVTAFGFAEPRTHGSPSHAGYN